jgi:hypothetical protein
MIVSYARKFIFIKTKKTAGTTVEAVLAMGCASGDIVTHPSDKYVGLDPAKFSALFESESAKPREAEDDEERPDKRRGKHRGDFFNHMNAQAMHKKIDPSFWDSALKLTVERHPYEKAVSQAYWRLSRGNRWGEEFPAYLDRIVRTGDYVGFKRWSIDGKVAVDEFIRQESLQADLSRISERLGFPIPQVLPQLKNQTRTDRRPAKEILNDEQKEIVFMRCREEFEILGYER